MEKRAKFVPTNQLVEFIHTQYEEALMKEFNVSFEFLKEARTLSKGLHMTLPTAITTHLKGELVAKSDKRHDFISTIETKAEKAQDVVLTKSDSLDDVARILRQFMENGDLVGLRKFMVFSGCDPDKVDRLVTDWELETVNVGIIRMRAGNMLRNSLRRKL